MPELSTLALFASAALVLTATPGPDMLLIASTSAGRGRLAGLFTFIGIAVGTYCHALAAAIGLAHIVATVPIAYEIVRWIGCAYLAYLAVKALASKSGPAAGDKQGGRDTISGCCLQGLLTNVLNPKMALFVLAFFPQFIRPEAGSLVVQMLVLATTLNAIGFLVNGCVILLSSRVGRSFRTNVGQTRWAQYLLATVFGGLAIRMALGGKP